jgi:hypothetical protein
VKKADQAIGRAEAIQGQTPVMTGVRPGFLGTSLPTTISSDEQTTKTKGKQSNGVSFDPGGGHRMGRFWVPKDDLEDDEEEITTPTIEDLITAASRVGVTVEELIEAEAELQEVDKVSHSSPDTADVHCPRAGRIIHAITRGKALKHPMKPWSGPLPKPRVSPP